MKQKFQILCFQLSTSLLIQLVTSDLKWLFELIYLVDTMSMLCFTDTDLIQSFDHLYNVSCL